MCACCVCKHIGLTRCSPPPVMSGIELKPISESQSGRSNFLLPLGKTVIGRGSVLGVSDKRVSRNHGVVEVSDGKLKIMSTHTNPTFYQANGTAKLVALPKDVWQYLDHGDRISLTPEQHIYEVVIDDRPMNKESQSLGTSLTESPLKQLSSKQHKQGEDKEGHENNRMEENNKGSEENIKPNNNDSRTKHSKSDGEDNREDNEKDHKTKRGVEQDEPDAGVSKTKNDKADTVTLPGQKEIALPLQRERKLPEWMASLETGQTAEDGKPVTTGSTARGRGRGRGRAKGAGTPSKPRAATTKAKKSSPISDDEGSEDDYKPAVKRTPSRGRGRPRAGKGTPRGKGREAAQPRRVIPPEQSDEDEGDGDGDVDDGDFVKDVGDENKEEVPRRWGHGKTRDQASVKRRAKLAMDYSEDFMESAGESEEEEMPVPEGDEGSDWEPDSHSPRMSRSRSPSKGKRTPGRTSGRTPRRKRTGGRRHSRRSSDDDDSDMSEQEVYIPRPTKRSGRAISSSQDLMPSLDDTPRKRIKKANNGKKKREVCQYGKKCYRKNPLHSEEYSHPGDSDYMDEEGEGEEEEEEGEDGSEGEEEDKEECPYGSDCYRKNKRHLKEFKHTKAPGRPKRQAAKRKATVVDGASDDDGAENTYDYKDSFLDDGTQETLGDSPSVESDWNPVEAEADD
ncbi:aprataxin and PNK-like factor [Asterias rubens]|uniref:aprataxin and PNK-like factor n=1 Tax=Asterias rubens TaxID=7604 RepID=UPI0014559DB6|nr:aprataxin and PNK-like factor [Asterias rubens]